MLAGNISVGSCVMISMYWMLDYDDTTCISFVTFQKTHLTDVRLSWCNKQITLLDNSCMFTIYYLVYLRNSSCWMQGYISRYPWVAFRVMPIWKVVYFRNFLFWTSGYDYYVGEYFKISLCWVSGYVYNDMLYISGIPCIERRVIITVTGGMFQVFILLNTRLCLLW